MVLAKQKHDAASAEGDALVRPDSMSRTTPQERSRAFTILFFSLMCLGAGQSVMFAILPSFARKLGLTEFQVSLPFVASATN
jgi:hypothetical protein